MTEESEPIRTEAKVAISITLRQGFLDHLLFVLVAHGAGNLLPTRATTEEATCHDTEEEGSRNAEDLPRLVEAERIESFLLIGNCYQRLS